MMLCAKKHNYAFEFVLAITKYCRSLFRDTVCFHCQHVILSRGDW